MSPTHLPAYDKQVRYWRLSQDVLGNGTTSTVVRATHVKLPTLCAAVKIISRSGLLAKAGADPTALHLVDTVIHREIILMKIAQHERNVRLYDFVQKGDLVYIIMEHAPHKTLFDLFRASSSYIPRSLVIHIFSQLMQGLAYTHALHIVHRDLKLENIFIFSPDVKVLLDEENTTAYTALNIKIGDFGLAHVDDPSRLSTVFHGSPHYQAPEVWLRVPHRPLPTDVWSAGVVLYALLCRRLPFDPKTLRNTVNLRAEDQKHAKNDLRHESDPQRFISLPAGERYMCYDVPEIIYPAADNLLRKIFAYDPAVRPTARGMLWDIFFEGLPEPRDQDVPQNNGLVMDPRVEYYDLATLCIPPGRYVPYGDFIGSALERAVSERVINSDGGNIAKLWAQRLSAYEKGRDTWEAEVAVQVAENKRKKHTKSLGRKNMTVEVLGHKEMNIMIPRPKLTGSLSFNSFRLKVAPKTLHNSMPRCPEPPPHTLQRASSSVASTLQDRREALLRRAYELGFGTGDLRAFADEAGMIVRVAREGNWQMGLEEIAREVERRTMSDAGYRKEASERLIGDGPAFASAATTLVSQNVESIKHGRLVFEPWS